MPSCHDNAVVEAFFRTLKAEEIFRHFYQTADELYASVAEYIGFLTVVVRIRNLAIEHQIKLDLVIFSYRNSDSILDFPIECVQFAAAISTL